MGFVKKSKLGLVSLLSLTLIGCGDGNDSIKNDLKVVYDLHPTISASSTNRMANSSKGIDKVLNDYALVLSEYPKISEKHHYVVAYLSSVEKDIYEVLNDFGIVQNKYPSLHVMASAVLATSPYFEEAFSNYVDSKSNSRKSVWRALNYAMLKTQRNHVNDKVINKN